MKAKYFIIDPTDSTIEKAESKLKYNHKFQDANPLSRLRQRFVKRSDPTEKLTVYIPIPRSRIPQTISTNTALHPADIFYNLSQIKVDPTINNTHTLHPNCIKQLNDLYKCDVLSYAPIRNQRAAELTYNRRFPYAKAHVFNPPSPDLVIRNLVGIQSLHLLAFSLNVRMFLHYQMGNRYFTLYLGADAKYSCDIHFQVTPVVITKTVSAKRGNEDNTQQKKDKFLDLKLIDFNQKDRWESETLSYHSFNAPEGDIAFLELEGRDLIPYFKTIKCNSERYSDILVQYLPDSPNKKSFSLTNKGQILVAKKAHCPKLGILKTIATKFADELSQLEDLSIRKDKSKHFMVAETNNSAFLIKCKGSQVIKDPCPSDPPIDFDQFSVDTWSDLDPTSYLDSYRFYSNTAYTFQDILNSQNPLLHLLPYIGLLEIVVKIIENPSPGLILPTSGNPINILVNIPLIVREKKSAGPFLIFQKNDDSSPELPTCKAVRTPLFAHNANARPRTITNWLAIANMYPQIEIPAINDQSIPSLLRNVAINDYIEKDSNPFFQYFITFLAHMPICLHTYLVEHHKVDKTILQQYLYHPDRRTRYLSKVIYDVYMNCSQASCLYYFSQADKNKADLVNPELMYDLSTLNEFDARMTQRILEVDQIFVEENAKKFACPVRLDTFKQQIEQLANQMIPDPPFVFKTDQDNGLIIQSQLDDDRITTITTPTEITYYSYEFNRIMKNGQINPCSSFTIQSLYQLFYVYNSGNKLYCLGHNENQPPIVMNYGSCTTTDGEVVFHPRQFEVLYYTAVYVENDSCLIVYQLKQDQKSSFIGINHNSEIFDINVTPFQIDFVIVAMTIITSTYIAAIDTELNKHVFRFNGTTKTIEYNGDDDLWRLKHGSAPDLLLDQRQQKVNPPVIKPTTAFIGLNDFRTGVFSADATDGTVRINQIGTKNITINFKTESSYYQNHHVPSPLNEYEQESKSLNLRLKNPNNSANTVIPSMLSCLPLQSKISSESTNDTPLTSSGTSKTPKASRSKVRRTHKQPKTAAPSKPSNDTASKSSNDTESEPSNDTASKPSNNTASKPSNNNPTYTTLDINLAMCELMPFLVFTNDKIISYDNKNSNFYTYQFDPMVYSSPDTQIYGYYANTLRNISLFSVESLFASYAIKKARIVIINESNGIGVRFSNLLFGTRFESRAIRKNDIWVGFSGSKGNETIILLTTVDDIDNLALSMEKEIQHYDQLVFSSFSCKNEFGLNSIVGSKHSNSKKPSPICNITYNSDIELQKNVLLVNKEIQTTNLNSSPVARMKQLLALYSTFHQFQNVHPIETIQAYVLHK